MSTVGTKSKESKAPPPSEPRIRVPRFQRTFKPGEFLAKWAMGAKDDATPAREHARKLQGRALATWAHRQRQMTGIYRRTLDRIKRKPPPGPIFAVKAEFGEREREFIDAVRDLGLVPGSETWLAGDWDEFVRRLRRFWMDAQHGRKNWSRPLPPELAKARTVPL
jgi:hypothetical protein